MSIDMIMTNSDDTLYRNRRSETPDVELYAPEFVLLRPHIENLTENGKTVLISTGRNARQVSYITQMTGMNGLSICEMGQTVFVPQTDYRDFQRGRSYFGNLRRYRLPSGSDLFVPELTSVTQHDNGFSFPTVHAYRPDLRPALDEIWRMKDSLDIGRLREFFGDKTVIHLDERSNILTFELRNRTGEELKQHVLFGNSDVLTPGARRLVADGKLVLISAKDALDIQPPITKETTSREIMNVYEMSPDNALYIGDSDHSDGPVISIVRYGGAVGNAGDPLKARIKAKGRDGYVAAANYTEGTLEILRHFFSQN